MLLTQQTVEWNVNSKQLVLWNKNDHLVYSFIGMLKTLWGDIGFIFVVFSFSRDKKDSSRSLCLCMKSSEVNDKQMLSSLVRWGRDWLIR